MLKGSHHLTCEQHCRSEVLKNSGISRDAIARQLGYERSTLSLEIKRNARKRGCRDKQAQGK